MFKLPSFVILLLLSLWQGELVSGGHHGARALPTAVQRYLSYRFRELNPTLRPDGHYYLQRLAMTLVACDMTNGIKEGFITMRGHNHSYVAFVEFQAAKRTRKNFDDLYNPIIDRWVDRKMYNTQIENAKIYGCSINSGCGEEKNEWLISCVFSPGSELFIPTADYIDDTTVEITTTTTTTTSTTTTTTTTTTPTTTTTTTTTTTEVIDLLEDMPRHHFKNCQVIPRAFRDNERKVVEQMTGSTWDKTFLLENLSSFDVTCGLLNPRGWRYDRAEEFANQRNKKIRGVFGHELNRGSTYAAIKTILKRLKIPSNHKVGCSVIPDCVTRDRMYVVVSCVYEVHAKNIEDIL